MAERRTDQIQITTLRETITISGAAREGLLARLTAYPDGDMIAGPFRAVGTTRPVDLGRAEEAALLDVPAGPVEYGMPGRRQAREVSHLAARRQAQAGSRGQAQEFHQP